MSCWYRRARRALWVIVVFIVVAAGCRVIPGDYDPSDFGLGSPHGHCGGRPGTHGFNSPSTSTRVASEGDDVIIITGGPVTVDAGAGDDLICVRGLGAPDQIVAVIGGDGVDKVYGNAHTVCGAEVTVGCDPPVSRVAQAWPFRWDSIWNVPIGDDAAYLPAQIQPSTAFGVFADEDVLILEPDAPQVDVLAHDANWDPNRPRCESIVSPPEVLMTGMPVPDSFTTEPTPQFSTPNHSAAILMPDGQTIRQTQPLHRCGPGGPLISQYGYADDNIFLGDGIDGAHGGSAMSSMGGAIRVGELVPGGEIHHALKLVLDSSQYLSFDPADPTPGYRWPATKADALAPFYGGQVPELEMGALLALDPDFPLELLRTEPAKILAQALIDYGGYVVDSSGWATNYFVSEFGPDGRVIDEFPQHWGHEFTTEMLPDCTDDSDPLCRWSKDIADLFVGLHVITNNGPSSIGGPGARRRPCAPPFTNGTGQAPSTCTTSGA